MLLFAVSLRVRQEGRHLEGVYPRGPRALRRRARRGQEEVQDALRGHGTASANILNLVRSSCAVSIFYSDTIYKLENCHLSNMLLTVVWYSLLKSFLP